MKIRWIKDEGEPDRRFGPGAPGTKYNAIGFPPAWPDRPWIISNFVADKNGLVVADNLKDPLAILGKASFPDGKPLTPDPGAEADWRFMRILRAYADMVMWGANTLRLQPRIIPDLYDPQGKPITALHEFRKTHGMPYYPPLVLVTDSGNLDFSLPAFHTAELETLVLTNEVTADRLRPQAAGTNAKIIGIGTPKLNMTQGLKSLRLEWGAELILCEGGHSLIESLHAGGFLDEVFVTTSNVALEPSRLKNPKYLFDFRQENARLVAHGKAGQFEFRRWRFNQR